MRRDIIILIVIISSIIQTIGVFGIILYWMRKMHNSIIDKFVAIERTSIANIFNQLKGCDDIGEQDQ